jgi:hypothetical protein
MYESVKLLLRQMWMYKLRSDLVIRCSRKQSTPLQFCSAGFHGLDTSSVYYDVEINTHAFQMFCPFVLQTFAASGKWEIESDPEY